MSVPSLFGMLILDREPFVLADLPGLSQAWLQDAGGFAAVGLVLYLLYALRTPPEQAKSAQLRAGVSPFMLLMAVVALLCYAVYGFLLFTNRGVDVVNYKEPVDPNAFVKYVPPKFSANAQPLALMAGGLFALLGIGQPFVASLGRVKFRRLWALAKLGFKEAVRNRLFWVFLIFLLPFLFPVKWFHTGRPEDELRDTISVTSLFMQILLLVPAALLAAFSIPNDIKNQNIYTVVTKPIERFEIVLGRFVGYGLLMTAALFGMTAVSWVLISAAGVGEKAREETYKARVPARGKLQFASRRAEFEGTNVGREFDYRRYIGGDPASTQRAVWSFASVPSSLTRADRDHVPCEFTFDIYRMTKGEENKGVFLEVRVVSWQCPQKPPVAERDGSWQWVDLEKKAAYEARAKELLRATPGVSPTQADNPDAVLGGATPDKKGLWAVAEKLAEEFGYFEATGKEIFDYHPSQIPVPVGLFKNATASAPKAAPGQATPPAVQVFVKCTTRGQLLGVAQDDLYLIEGERAFYQNYFKSAFGLWCRVLIVIGLAVACSTYLAGVISFLCAAFLFLAGYASEHVADMASGQSFVGGPFRSLNLLMRAEQPTAQFDATSPLQRAAVGLDVGFSSIVRRFVNMVPDVYVYSWSDFVKHGFDIPFECLVMNFLVMAGYLIPWFILGFYLMRSREVAA